jgi:hypothetical protein
VTPRVLRFSFFLTKIGCKKIKTPKKIKTFSAANPSERILAPVTPPGFFDKKSGRPWRGEEFVVGYILKIRFTKRTIYSTLCTTYLT